MQLGVFTQWIKANSIEELAQRIHQLDLQCVVLDSFPGLQINFTDPDPAISRRIRSAFENAGVKIAAIGDYCNLAAPDPIQRQSIHARFRGLMQLCEQVGIPMICSEAGTYHPTSEWEWDPANGQEQAFEHFVETIRPLVAAAHEHQVILGLEPYVMTIIHTPERAARLMRELASPYLRLVADPAGMLTRITLHEQATFLPAAFHEISPYISLVHVEDCRPDPNGHFLWLAAGKGLINYPLFMDLIVQSGYQGPLILEHLSEAELPAARDYVLTHWSQACKRAQEQRV